MITILTHVGEFTARDEALAAAIVEAYGATDMWDENDFDDMTLANTYVPLP